MKNKKGAIVTGLTTIFLYFGFVLLLLIFFLPFKATKGPTEVKIGGYIEAADVNYEILNYLRIPVEVDIGGVKKEMTIADIVGMVDIEEGKEEKIKVFQETTKEVFERQYPYENLKEWRGVNPWWLRVYAADEEPEKSGDGKYFDYRPPGKGYTYGPGANCNPGKDIVSIVLVPKIDKGYVKVVFCILKTYIETVK